MFVAVAVTQKVAEARQETANNFQSTDKVRDVTVEGSMGKVLDGCLVII